MPASKNPGKRKKNNGSSKNTSKAKKAVTEPKTAPSKSTRSRGSGSSPAQIGAIHFILAFASLIAGILTPKILRSFSDSNILIKNVMIKSVDEDIMDVPTMKKTEKIINDNEEEEQAPSEEELDSVAVADQTPASKLRFVECNEENLMMFLHDEPINGMHIICFEMFGDGELVKIWENAFKEDEYKLIGPDYYVDLISLIDGEEYVLPHHKTNTQPWAMFSTSGERLVGELDERHKEMYEGLAQHGMVILMDGGQWIWPGVRIGFKRSIELETGYTTSKNTPKNRTVEIETLSLVPLVLSVRNFISDSECTHIQNLAEPDMKYSDVTLMDHDQGREASDFRTSQSAFVRATDEITTALEVRTSSLTRVPKNHQEHTQVLRYGKNEKYSAHVDWFDEKLYQEDQNTLNMIQNGKRNRMATVFWYLSDVEEGGETNFPRHDGLSQPHDLSRCYQGLMVKPERGKVIIFYSLMPDGKGDDYSIHAACPVKEGIKWAANKWVWNARMGFIQ